MLKAGIAIGVVLLLAASPALAASEADVNASIDSLLGNSARYETMLKLFQQSVAKDDKPDVAAFVRYPIVVDIGGKKRTIRTAAQFIKSYDQIMTPDIVGAVTSQKYEDLFVRDQGVMFGQGEVWVNGICLDKKCDNFVPKVITIQHTGG